MTKITVLFAKNLVVRYIWLHLNKLDRKCWKFQNYLMMVNFSRQMNSIAGAEDAVANGIKYLLQCWVSAKQQVSLKDKSLEAPIVDETSFVIADIEILNMLPVELSDPSYKVITSNQVESVYRSLLSEYGVKTTDTKKSYKPYLKQLIEEHLPKFT